MSRQIYRCVKYSDRKAMAKAIKDAIQDQEAGYIQMLRYTQAYLKKDFPMFYFIASRSQIYGVYNVKALEIERITGIDRRRCDKLIDKLVDMGFVDGVDNKLNKDIITVSINGLHQFKTMCEGLDEDDVASLRDMIGDKYFVDYYKKFKNKILEKKKMPPNDVP
jgi:hypothetical protein